MEYAQLSELYEKLESTTKRLEKTKYLADFLSECPAAESDKIILLVQGLVFPRYDERKIGVASKLLVKALNTATGISTDEIERLWKKTGDLGKVAQDTISKKKQHTLFSEELTVSKVYSNIRKLAVIEGTGSTDIKLKIIAELLTSAKPKESKYIIRLILEELRVGLGEGTIRDAIAWAYYEKQHGKIDTEKATSLFGKESELAHIRDTLQGSYDIVNDYAEIARILMEHGIEGLSNLQISPLKPIKVMLAQKVKDVTEGFERVGKPCAFEYKYDGFRMIIGKEDNNVVIHTRRLENVTGQFPEVVELIKKNITARSIIFDSEAVGYDPKTKKYVPFQNISQRIKRKYDIEKLAQEVPVELNIFDVLYHEGKSVVKEPYSKRREIIADVVKPIKYHINIASQIVTDKEDEAEKFYKESLQAGNEGVMLKTLDAPYKPGARVGYMVKLKPLMETLDLVIVGGEWGEGKRSGWISSFVLAVYDPDMDEFLEIGKFGTGIKEKAEEGASFDELTELLRPHILSEKGRELTIKPQVVVEISFEEIQKSPSYSSGYALRFPRLVRIRPDRSPDQASTLSQAEEMYKAQ